MSLSSGGVGGASPRIWDQSQDQRNNGSNERDDSASKQKRRRSATMGGARRREASTSAVHWPASDTVARSSAPAEPIMSQRMDLEAEATTDSELSDREREGPDGGADSRRSATRLEKATKLSSLDKKGKGVDRAGTATSTSVGHSTTTDQADIQVNSHYEKPQRLSWHSNASSPLPRSISNTGRTASATTAAGSNGLGRRRTLNALAPLKLQANSRKSRNASAASSQDSDTDMESSVPEGSDGPLAPLSPDPGRLQNMRSYRFRAASDGVLSSSPSSANGTGGYAEGQARSPTPLDSPSSPYEDGPQPTVRLPTRKSMARASSSSMLPQNPKTSRTPRAMQPAPFGRPKASSGILNADTTNIANSPRSPRPRAKSAILEHRTSLGLPNVLPDSAPVGRSFSSCTPRRRKESTASRGFPTIPNEDEISPQRTPRQIVKLNEDTSNSSAASSNVGNPSSSPLGPPQPSHLKTLPMSISAMLGENVNQQTSLSSHVPDGPSLQELLSQVDVKGALAIVRQVQGNGSAPGASLGALNAHLTNGHMYTPSARKESPSRTRPTSFDHGEDASMLSSLPSAYSARVSSAAGTNAPLFPSTSGFNGAQINHGSSVQVQQGQESIRPRTSVDGVDSLPPSDTSKRRLSFAGFRVGGNGMEKRAKAKVAKQHQHDQEQKNLDSSLADMLERVTPAMHKYASQTKWEMEMRYRPIYMALSAGECPPNPAEIARWRYRKDEIQRRTSSHVHQGPKRAIHLLSADGEDNSMSFFYDSIRLKGHRHPIWEVYPSDYADFARSGGAILDTEDSCGPLYPNNSRLEEPFKHSTNGGPTQEAAMGRPRNRRQISSDYSFRSLSSIREGPQLSGGIATRLNGEIRKRSNSSQFSNGLMKATGLVNDAGGPLSPNRSARSDRSQSFSHEEALALAKYSGSLSSQPRKQLSGPVAPNDHLQRDDNVSTDQLARQVSQRASGSPKHAGAGPKKKISDRLRQLTGRDMDSYPYIKHHPPSSTADDGRSDTEQAAATTQDGLPLPLNKSQFASKSSSLANLSKMLAPRKVARGGNDTDGYKSTDNEDTGTTNLSVGGGNRDRRSKWMSSPPAMNGGPHLNGSDSAMEDLASIEPSNQETDNHLDMDSIFDRGPQPEAELIDVEDADYSAAMR